MSTSPATGWTAAALLVGDAFGEPPIDGPMLLFKGLYEAAFLFHFRRTLKAWGARKHSIRLVDETGAAVN